MLTTLTFKMTLVANTLFSKINASSYYYPMRVPIATSIHCEFEFKHVFFLVLLYESYIYTTDLCCILEVYPLEKMDQVLEQKLRQAAQAVEEQV